MPHNIAFVALGTGLLWFGWFGFNGGSALAANGIAAYAFVNTDISGSVAMIVWLLISWKRDKKPSIVGALTGAVAGLATVTPAAGYIQPWAAVLIGAASGAICYGACQIRSRLELDDALDVFGCHGAGGILGSVLVGVFATSAVNSVNGALYGNMHQLVVQIVGVVIVSVYTFGLTFGMLKIINIFEPVRVSKEAEILGLDDYIHHEVAYL